MVRGSARPRTVGRRAEDLILPDRGQETSTSGPGKAASRPGPGITGPDWPPRLIRPGNGTGTRASRTGAGKNRPRGAARGAFRHPRTLHAACRRATFCKGGKIRKKPMPREIRLEWPRGGGTTPRLWSAEFRVENVGCAADPDGRDAAAPRAGNLQSGDGSGCFPVPALRAVERKRTAAGRRIRQCTRQACSGNAENAEGGKLRWLRIARIVFLMRHKRAPGRLSGRCISRKPGAGVCSGMTPSGGMIRLTRGYFISSRTMNDTDRRRAISRKIRPSRPAEEARGLPLVKTPCQIAARWLHDRKRSRPGKTLADARPALRVRVPRTRIGISTCVARACALS